MQPRSSYVTVTDLFCGAGGSSQGARYAGAEVRLAMNHSKLAIETHNSNFPETTHVLTDISTSDPRHYGSTDMLIASPECVNHTVAKGVRRAKGQVDLWGKSDIDPDAERSRATMWDVVRYSEQHRYNVIITENVVEAGHWVLFDAWLGAMHALGYAHEIVCLNSMFVHPTPQSRDRMYVVFWRQGNRKPDLRITPLAYCTRCAQDVESVQRWKRAGQRVGKYGARNQYVYRCPRCHDVVDPYYFCAATAIDWSLAGERIGDRKYPLKEKTLARIRYGLEKYGKCLVNTAGDVTGTVPGRVYPLTGPAPTQTGWQDKALVLPFLLGQQSGATARPVTQAAPTVSTGGAISLLVPAGGTWNEEAKSVQEPYPTQTTREMYGIMQTPFLFNYYGGRPATYPVDDAMRTVTSYDNHALICPPLLVGLRNNGKADPVTGPLRTVCANGLHHGLLVPYYGTGQARATDAPYRTVSTHDREALVQPAVAVEDCLFRMLHVREIQRAMAFPDDYILLGTGRDKVKLLGNALTPPVMSLLFERCVATLAG